MAEEGAVELARRWQAAEERALSPAPPPTRRGVQVAAVVAVLVAVLGLAVFTVLGWSFLVGSNVVDGGRLRGVAGAVVQAGALLLLVVGAFKAYRTASGRGWSELVAPLTRTQRTAAYRTIRQGKAAGPEEIVLLRAIASRQADDGGTRTVVVALLVFNVGALLQAQSLLSALASVVLLLVLALGAAVVLRRGRRARRFLRQDIAHAPDGPPRAPRRS